jgi:hypothetical protein
VPVSESDERRRTRTFRKFIFKHLVNFDTFCHVIVEENGKKPRACIEGIQSLLGVQEVRQLETWEWRNSVPQKGMMLYQDDIFHVRRYALEFCLQIVNLIVATQTYSVPPASLDSVIDVVIEMNTVCEVSST